MSESRDQEKELVIEDEKTIEDPDMTEFLDDEYVFWDEDEGVPDNQIIGCGSEILSSRKKK